MYIASIIIPYFDRHLYIEDCLNSIQKQVCGPLEVIIINDCSSATSSRHLLEVIDCFKDTLDIVYLAQPTNLGAGAARNRGLEIARGKYCLFLDSDDMLCGRFSLDFRIDFLNTHAEFNGVAGYFVSVQNLGKIVFNDYVPTDSYNSAVSSPDKTYAIYCEYALNRSTGITSLFMLAGGAVFRTAAVKDIKFNPVYESEEDIDWILQYFDEGNKLQLVKVPFFISRQHPQQYHHSIKPELVTKLKTRISNLTH